MTQEERNIEQQEYDKLLAEFKQRAAKLKREFETLLKISTGGQNA